MLLYTKQIAEPPKKQILYIDPSNNGTEKILAKIRKQWKLVLLNLKYVNPHKNLPTSFQTFSTHITFCYGHAICSSYSSKSCNYGHR